MTLREKQSVFLLNFAKLIQWVYEQGWELTAGELLRTPEQQAIYVQEGKSKTSDSKHLIKMAGDLNLFIDGVFQTDGDAYKPLGDYWKSLNTDNIWGGDWEFKDNDHFQMRR